MSRSLLSALLLVLASCTQQPPERSPLPDVEEVLPEPLGCQLSVGEPRGARVLSVAQGSPAEPFLAPGDVIVSLDGTSVSGAGDLVAAVGVHRTGEEIELVYRREEATETITLILDTHPSDTTKPYLGVTIRSDFETITVDEADDQVETGPTVRSLEIGGVIYLFDAIGLEWQSTGIEVPEGLDWMATASGFYGASSDDPAVLFDLATEDELDHDGFRGWEPRQLIGSVGDLILLMVTADIAEQPGFVNVAVAGLDPIAGSTIWVSPVREGFGIPVAAHGSPDDRFFVVVGTDQESGEQIGVEIYNADGTLRAGGDQLIDLGTPIGWFDGETVGFHSGEEIVSLLDAGTGSLSTLTLAPSLVETQLTAVGDGRHVLAIQGRSLLLDDLTTEGEVQVLADDCPLGKIGAPGWGT